MKLKVTFPSGEEMNGGRNMLHTSIDIPKVVDGAGNIRVLVWVEFQAAEWASLVEEAERTRRPLDTTLVGSIEMKLAAGRQIPESREFNEHEP